MVKREQGHKHKAKKAKKRTHKPNFSRTPPYAVNFGAFIETFRPGHTSCRSCGANLWGRGVFSRKFRETAWEEEVLASGFGPICLFFLHA